MVHDRGKSLQVEAVVDRLEGAMAVLVVLDQEVPWPRQALPEGVREGHVLTMTIRLDKQATTARREKIQLLLERLVKRGQVAEE